MEAKTEIKAEKKVEKTEAKKKPQEEIGDVLIRILGQDIKGRRTLYAGLTYIKGVSWSIANAVCIRLGLDKNMRIEQLDKDTIRKIEHELTHLNVPAYMMNRRNDLETGTDNHLLTTNLDIKKEFDIKRLKKVRSYKGIRHGLGLPVRGQRTRSHFRKKGGAVGIKKKNDKKA